MPSETKPAAPVRVTARAEIEINADGEHAFIKLTVDGPAPPEFERWVRFAYCNDIVWRICSMLADGSETYWGMVRRDLYKNLFRRIHGQQFMVPGAD